MAFGLIAVFAFSLYGWGRVFRRAFHMQRGTWPATAALGMACLVFLGGVLNLARLAHPWALLILAGMGLLLSFPGLRGVSIKLRTRPVIVFLLAALIVGFTVRTQLPPKAYNFHDDYQKYFAHAVRMVETGTVYGSPLSAIGSQTLGGQAFLQAFLVAFFPISYINGFDSVFAMFLCLMLASEFTSGRPGLLAMTVISMLSVIVINPQYVNVSALYSGSALVMALAAIFGDPREFPRDSRLPSSAAAGLLYAALIALKPTFALFVTLHLLFLAMALGVRWAIRTGLSLVAFVSPWLLLHSPHYLAALRGSRAVQIASGPVEARHLNFLSFDRLDYGSSVASYTLLIAAIGISGLMAFWAAGRQQATGKEDRRGSSSAHLLAAACAAGIAAYFILVLAGPLQSGYRHAVRYYAPFAIGLAPAAFGLAALHMSASGRFRSRMPRLMLPLLVAVLPLLMFLPSVRDRVHQALTSGSILAFFWLADDPGYLEYNQQVLYGAARENVAAMLRTVPPGEPVIAWIGTPFYLDYARNRIFDAEPGGLIPVWATIPPARYLIWEYDGYATESEADLIERAHGDGALDRLTAARTLEFLHLLTAWAAQGQVLYDDGECKVVRLAELSLHN